MREFTVAGAQIACFPNDVQKNIEKVKTWMHRAMEEVNPQLIVFPETITTGFSTTLPAQELWDLVDTVEGISEEICKEAQALKVHVVLPTYTRGPKRGKVNNSAVLIGDNGDILGVYNKTHPFGTEKEWTEPGTSAEAYDTPFAKIGMIICYDGDYPELSRVIALKGAEVIVRPSALMRSFELWKLTCQARAFDNHVYMVGVNATGNDMAANYYFGNSMIVSPLGATMGLAVAGEGIVYAKLNPDPLRYISEGMTKPMLYNHLEDRNLAAYQGILCEGKSPFPLSGWEAAKGK